MRQNTVIRTFNIHRDAMNRLGEISVERDVSISQIVREAIDMYLMTYNQPMYRFPAQDPNDYTPDIFPPTSEVK
jgi:hypothetical protein